MVLTREPRLMGLGTFVENLSRNEGVYSTTIPIPCLLLPDETLKRYEQKFERWLSKTSLTLSSFRNEPHVERLFRGRKLVKLRTNGSRTEDKENAWLVLTNTESCTSRLGSEEAKQQHNKIRGRSELLAKREMTADEFWEDVERYRANGYLGAGSKLKPIARVLPLMNQDFF
ncbi:hypothetical protein GQ600_178 [Phytophthora cactorum]|nr:hypothetical protein GQ600_178 [Phytophthora cactorum]